MSRRNFILLLIVLGVIILALLGYFFLQSKPAPAGGNVVGTNFLAQFNPFGNGAKTPTNPAPPTTTTETPPVTTPAAPVVVKLNKVSSMPIAGFTVFSEQRIKTTEASTPPLGGGTGEGSSSIVNNLTPALPKGKGVPLTEFAPLVRYVARETGNIYETFADKLAEKQFSKTIIPQIYEAFFGNKGGSVVMRYLNPDQKTIATFTGNLPKETLGTDPNLVNDIKGSFLPENISDISLSGDTGSAFYLFTTFSVSGESAIGTTFNFTTGKKAQVFTSPFTEWLSQWPIASMITLTTKPAAGFPGYMYSLNPSTKTLTRILGPVSGLTTNASPNGKLILYGDDTLSLNVYHADTKAANLLSVRTLPEKCVWSSASDALYCAVPETIGTETYPDSWYQGTASFSDQIWKIDVQSGKATLILDPATVAGAGAIDGIKLALDPGENYLFFVNKKDSYLWEFALK